MQVPFSRIPSSMVNSSLKVQYGWISFGTYISIEAIHIAQCASEVIAHHHVQSQYETDLICQLSLAVVW